MCCYSSDAMTNGRTFNVPTVSAVVSAMAIATVGHPVPDMCDKVGGAVAEEDDWMEMEVVMGFRVWQLMFLALAGLITVVVLLCCFMKCRVPRTKQEIEADFKRKEITKRFRFLLDKVQIEDTSLRTALEKVNELYRNREQVKLSKKKKEIDEEDIEECSFDSNELFAEEKLTIIERIKRILKLEKVKESDTEEDSAKTEQEKESDVGIPTEDEDDDESGSEETKKTRQRNKSPLPQHKTVDSLDTVNEDSPKRIEDIRSTLSLVQDSPPLGASSRLSLLQDSPPHSNLTLLQDSPPESTTLQENLGRQKSDSQESDSSTKFRDYSRSKTDSQESRESQRSEPSRQKSCDSQDSKSSESRKQKTEIQDLKKSGYRRQEATDSQDSRNVDLRKQKSDSQESKRTDSVKNNSDSQDSKTSHSTRQKSDSRDSKVMYPSKRSSGSQDSKTSTNPKTDSLDSTKSYGTRQKSDSQEFKTSNHRRMKSNSHDCKNSDSPKQNKNLQDSSKPEDSIRQLSDPQDSTSRYRLENRRESLATNTTLLKDFSCRGNERFSKDKKNHSFPSTSKLRRTSSKDLNMVCSNSKETSFLDMNLTNPVAEELQDNVNSATENN